METAQEKQRSREPLQEGRKTWEKAKATSKRVFLSRQQHNTAECKNTSSLAQMGLKEKLWRVGVRKECFSYLASLNLHFFSVQSELQTPKHFPLYHQHLSSRSHVVTSCVCPENPFPHSSFFLPPSFMHLLMPKEGKGLGLIFSESPAAQPPQEHCGRRRKEAPVFRSFLGWRSNASSSFSLSSI